MSEDTKIILNELQSISNEMTDINNEIDNCKTPIS